MKKELSLITGAESSGINAISVDVNDISETPQNWTIYRKPDQSGQEWNALCDSIEENGINTPLELSSDYYVISGHRRLAAARHVGLEKVPAFIRSDITIGEMDDAERTLLLTERNRGTRVKSDSEMYLEAAAQVDPEEAIREAQARKCKVFNKVKTSDLHIVSSVGGIRRTDPTKARSELMNGVLEEMSYRRGRGFLPTGERNIHYAILHKKLLTSSGRNGHVYGSKRGDSSLLSKLITDARSAGFLNWSDFIDETRPVYDWKHFGSVAEYERHEIDGLFKNYFSNVHRDQENHIEILVEKNTIAPLIVKGIGNKFRLTVSSCRGYGNLGFQVAERFQDSGKQKLIVIYISDLDPEGVDMPAAFKKYLAHDFGLHATTIRAGVTMEQVGRYNLPPDIDVKLSSSRAKGFIKEYGNQCWELDSMPPEILIKEVTSAVTQCLDLEILNTAMEREYGADIVLAQKRAAVDQFLRNYARQQIEEAVL